MKKYYDTEYGEFRSGGSPYQVECEPIKRISIREQIELSPRENKIHEDGYNKGWNTGFVAGIVTIFIVALIIVTITLYVT